MKRLIIICLIIFLAYSCMNESSGERSSKTKSSLSLEKKINSSLPADNNPIENPKIEIKDPAIKLSPEVLLNGIIDPEDGVHKAKITLPRNYEGLLYLSGLNLSSVKDKILYTRFRFGRELETIVIQGVVAKGSGITPDTEIDQLILDLSRTNFSDIRIHYDLFDYKDYSNSEDIEPVSNSRDKSLYCRGLRSEYDPTFQSTAVRPKCNYKDAKCLYSYASIIDSGLYDSSNLTSTRKYPLYDVLGKGYTNDSLEIAKGKCLPDSSDLSDVLTALGPLSKLINNQALGSKIQMTGGSLYSWMGPYRTSALEYWEVSGSAIFGKFGVFQKSIDNSQIPKSGYEANLFPKSVKMKLRAGAEYIGGNDPFLKKSKQSMLVAGDSLYMDGCSARAISPQIGKCNVVADIEVFYINSDGVEVILTKNVNLKVQLIEDQNIYSNPKTCQIDSNCGSDECCFNNQCFEKSLVGGVCIGEINTDGNKLTGEVCKTDLECASLCCSGSRLCAPHSNNPDEKVLCSKEVGQSCISREFCKEYYVTTCYKVKTGIIDNRQMCSVRCYYKPTLGDCVNLRCQAPKTPVVPYLDPKNPDCRDAIDPPTEF